MHESARMLRLAWDLERMALELKEKALQNLPEPYRSKMRLAVEVGDVRSDALASAVEAALAHHSV